MKRFSSILTVLIVSSAILIGCGGQKQTSTDTSQDTSQTTSQNTGNTSEEQKTSGTEDLLSKSYANIMKSGKYFMHYTATIEVNNKSIDAEFKSMSNGTSTSFQSVMNTDGQKITSRILIIGSSQYIMDDENKTYMAISSGQPSGVSPSTDSASKADYTGLTYAGKGTDTLNGKSLKYEEYKIEGGTLRYYFDGTKLYSIVLKTGDVTANMMVIEISDKIDDKLLTLDGYNKISLPQ